MLTGASDPAAQRGYGNDEPRLLKTHEYTNIQAPPYMYDRIARIDVPI